MKRSNSFAVALLALTATGGSAALVETGGAENRMAEAQASLASPTTMTQAIAAAEAAAGGLH